MPWLYPPWFCWHHMHACTCGIAYENKGDHPFGCSDQSVSQKSKLSNGAWNTIAHVNHQVAPTARFVDNADCVTTEMPQLLPHDLCKWLADIGIPLKAIPSYLTKQSPQAANFLSIHITAPPPHPPSQSWVATHTAVTTTYKHHKAKKKEEEVWWQRWQQSHHHQRSHDTKYLVLTHVHWSPGWF
jgi:hypothetical protein